MTTCIEAIAAQAAGCVLDNFPGKPFCATHDEDGNPPWDRCRWVPVAAMLTEKFRQDELHEHRYGTPVRPCPVCGEPVRMDRFVTEHRSCIDTCL